MALRTLALKIKPLICTSKHARAYARLTELNWTYEVGRTLLLRNFISCLDTRNKIKSKTTQNWRRKMREIKFRAKRKSDGKWAYGYFDGKHIIEDGPISIRNVWRILPETVGQFTGRQSTDYSTIFRKTQPILTKWSAFIHSRMVLSPSDQRKLNPGCKCSEWSNISNSENLRPNKTWLSQQTLLLIKIMTPFENICLAGICLGLLVIPAIIEWLKSWLILKISPLSKRLPGKLSL